MRWITVYVGLGLLAAATVGCQRQCFMTECDYDHYRQIGMPSWLECKPGTQVLPDPSNIVGAPATVNHPERPIRFLSLAEAISIGLEQGNIGSQSLLQPGFTNESLGSLQGRAFFGSDKVRVLALDPAISGADIEASLAKFDARWVSTLNYNTTDRPVGTPLDVFQTGQRGINAIETNDAQLRTALLKPLPTGGVAGITFTTDYQFTNLPARVNPSYRPALQFQFEQPLLQGYGIEINQLRANHPGSLLTQFPTGGRVEGILITRLRFDQARAEFERVVHFMVYNVEAAYWNLYGAYWSLYSREAAMRQAYEAWKVAKQRYDVGAKDGDIGNLSQARGQYELFRDQRISALGQVLESERQLRGLLGMPVEDGYRLVPVDTPTLAPYTPDWNTALNEALTLQPALVLAREELKFRQLDVIAQKNLLLPDLRSTFTYDINGIGNRLDGADANNAFRSLASNHFNNWTIGLRLDVPIGFRDAHAAVRVARLNLARSYYTLRDIEEKTQRYLAFQYRQLAQLHARIQALRAQREAFGRQVQARFDTYLAGRVNLDILLEAQRFWADALANEFNVIAQYNTALAGFEFAKGTILQHDNVTIMEGPLPQCACKRAVEHERERTHSLVLAEREKPVVHHPACGDKCGPTMPELPRNVAPSVPSLYERMPTIPKDDLEPLPPPRKTGEAMPRLDGLPELAPARISFPTSAGPELR